MLVLSSLQNEVIFSCDILFSSIVISWKNKFFTVHRKKSKTYRLFKKVDVCDSSPILNHYLIICWKLKTKHLKHMFLL